MGNPEGRCLLCARHVLDTSPHVGSGRQGAIQAKQTLEAVVLRSAYRAPPGSTRYEVCNTEEGLDLTVGLFRHQAGGHYSVKSVETDRSV